MKIGSWLFDGGSDRDIGGIEAFTTRRCGELVTERAHCLNAIRYSDSLQLLPQPADQHVEAAVERAELARKDGMYKRLAAHSVACGTKQYFQQSKFSRG